MFKCQKWRRNATVKISTGKFGLSFSVYVKISADICNSSPKGFTGTVEKKKLGNKETFDMDTNGADPIPGISIGTTS